MESDGVFLELDLEVVADELVHFVLPLQHRLQSLLVGAPDGESVLDSFFGTALGGLVVQEVQVLFLFLKNGSRRTSPSASVPVRAWSSAAPEFPECCG